MNLAACSLHFDETFGDPSPPIGDGTGLFNPGKFGASSTFIKQRSR
jgi:hypothetical protein